MGFISLLSRMLVLFIFICIGVLCTKLHIIDEHGSSSLNRMVIYICGPLLILRSVQSANSAYGASDILMLLLYSVLFSILTLIIALIASRLICRRSPLRGVFSLVTAFGNLVFMGIPVVSALYGEGAVFLLSICAIPFNFFIFSVGILLIVGGGKHSFPWKKVVVNPSLFATLLALVLFFLKVKIPAPVDEVMSYLGQMVVPLSMLLIGAALGRMSLKAVFSNGLNYAVCAVKLLIVPTVCSLVFRLYIKDPLQLGLFTVLSAMPSASISPILCAEYGGDSDFASRSVFLTTLLSILTIPLMIWLLIGRGAVT